MAVKLFNDDITPSCAYCAKMERQEGKMFCPRRKTVTERDSCRSYEYDPLKRVPKQAPRLPEFKPEDFFSDL